MNPLNKIMLGIGSGIVLIIAITIIWLCLANAHLRAALANAQSNVTACQMANDEFQMTVARQNQAVAELKKQSDEQLHNAQVAVSTAHLAAQKFRSDADRLAHIKSSGNNCKAASALIDNYIAGLK